MSGFATRDYGVVGMGGTPYHWCATGADGQEAWFRAPRLVDYSVLNAAAAWHLLGKADLSSLDVIADDGDLDVLLEALTAVPAPEWAPGA